MNTPVLDALKKGIPVTSGGYNATLIAYNPGLPAPIMCAVAKRNSTGNDNWSDPFDLESFTLAGKSLNPMVGDLRVKGWL